MPLAPLMERFGGRIEHVHVKGEPIGKGDAGRRIALRHYVSISGHRLSADIELDSWLSETLEAIAADERLASLIRAGEIEAVAWAAVLGREFHPSPAIAEDLIVRAEQAGVQILVENYTVGNEDLPSKAWFAQHIPSTASVGE